VISIAIKLVINALSLSDSRELVNRSDIMLTSALSVYHGFHC